MTINGVDMSDVLLRRGAWSLNKRWSVETFKFTVRNYIFGPTAYRVPIGADVVLHYRGDLMFGGQVQSIEEYRAGDEGPIFIDVNCICYDLIAHQVILTGETAPGTVHDIAFDFFTKYLAPKGCTWIGPGPGFPSPTIPKMTFIRASLGEIFNRMTKLSNLPWRINGDKWFAFVGTTLPLPMDPMRTDHFLAGVKIDQEYHEYGLRLIMQTGGTGEAKHSETHTANGVKKYFQVNVEPRPDEVKEEEGVETTTTYIPTQFQLNGVDTPFNGSPWNWDRTEHIAWTSGAAPVAGTTLKFSFDISFPAVVRVWTPSLLLADGQMNPATRIDKLLDVSHLTDVAETAAWGNIEIVRAGLTPRKLKGSTTIRGHYPYLVGRLALPEHNVDANFLLENVAIRDSDGDPNIFEHLIYDLEFIEGDRAGRQWEDLFTEMGGRGTQGGSVEIRGTGGAVNPSTPGGSGGTGGGGGGVGLPAGFTFQLGGDNNEYVVLDTTFRDIPELLPNMFGGPDMGTTWTFKAFAYILGSAGPIVEIELYAGSRIAIGTITTTGVLTVGPWGSFDQPVTVPGAATGLLCRARVVTGTANVVIGHCILYKG